MRIWIRLTAKETDEANRVGLARHVRAEQGGWQHTNYQTGDPTLDLLVHQKAARCELAAHIGLKTNFWNTLGTGLADLDDWIDVKERYWLNWDLKIALKCKPEFAYISVCSQRAPLYAIDGWCYGHEIMLKKNLRSLRPDRKPMYMLDACRYVPPIKTPQALMLIVKNGRAQ